MGFVLEKRARKKYLLACRKKKETHPHINKKVPVWD